MEKHVDTLIQAHAHLALDLRAHLVLLGQGTMQQALLEQTEQMERLHVFPYQAHPADLARILASADVYVSVWPHETFALSVIEAQACALPVFGVDSGALRERVLEGMGYLAPVDDAWATAELMTQAYARRFELGDKARRHVQATVSWKMTFALLMQGYARLVQGDGHALLSYLLALKR